MKQRFIQILGIITLLVVNMLTIVFAEDLDRAMIQEMTSVVRQVTLETFLQAIETHQWKSPHIYSHWYVENFTTEEDRPILNDARDFGRTLLERIVDWKTLMMVDVPFDQLRQDIERFATLAEWLWATRGYGNLFLAERCYDIATVGIGRLIVNLDYPLENALTLLNRVNLIWNPPSIRQQILNQEAGIDLFVSFSPDEREIQSALEETWSTGILWKDTQAIPDLKAALEGTPVPQEVEQIYLGPWIRQKFDRASPAVKAHPRFFTDDVFPDVVTTLSMWDKKWHEKLIIGFNAPNILGLQALTMFRKTVGYFPTTPEYNDHFYNSPEEAAFAHVWEHYATKETRNLDATAWQAYKEITTGRFLDQDTRREMQDRW